MDKEQKQIKDWLGAIADKFGLKLLEKTKPERQDFKIPKKLEDEYLGKSSDVIRKDLVDLDIKIGQTQQKHREIHQLLKVYFDGHKPNEATENLYGPDRKVVEQRIKVESVEFDALRDRGLALKQLLKERMAQELVNQVRGMDIRLSGANYSIRIEETGTYFVVELPSKAK